MVSVSEGTPGRGPDADSRTDAGDGRAPTNGRPVVPPVRYGPRNANQAKGASQVNGSTGANASNAANGSNGHGGSNDRTVSGPSSPQQYRAPQPPRPPANGSTGPGANGSGSNGSHPVTPTSYTRPRTNGAPIRPEPGEQERLIAEARIAAAARNASAAKVRSAAPLSATRTPAPPERNVEEADRDAASASVDETAVIPVVPTADTTVASPADLGGSTGPGSASPAEAVEPEKGRGVFGRRRGARERRVVRESQDQTSATATTAPQQPAGGPAVDAPPVEAPDVKDAEVKPPEVEAPADTTAEVETAAKNSEQEAGTEPAALVATEQTATTQDRPLTWRDRLGLPPKAPKPQPVDVPESPAAESAVAGAAVAADAAPDLAPPGTTASTTESTEVVQPAALQGRVDPTSPAPATTSDTVVIPAVDAESSAAAAATAQPVAAPKPKVGTARRTRKARLRLSRVDPWSVMKTSLLFSIAAGIILVVATYGVWSVLNASGLFDAVNDMVKSVVSTPGDTTPFQIQEYVNTQKIIGVAALIAVVDVLIFTALATLGSFLYNLAATVLGGLEVTLAED